MVPAGDTLLAIVATTASGGFTRVAIRDGRVVAEDPLPDHFKSVRSFEAERGDPWVLGYEQVEARANGTAQFTTYLARLTNLEDSVQWTMPYALGGIPLVGRGTVLLSNWKYAAMLRDAERTLESIEPPGIGDNINDVHVMWTLGPGDGHVTALTDDGTTLDVAIYDPVAGWSSYPDISTYPRSGWAYAFSVGDDLYVLSYSYSGDDPTWVARRFSHGTWSAPATLDMPVWISWSSSTPPFGQLIEFDDGKAGFLFGDALVLLGADDGWRVERLQGGTIRGGQAITTTCTVGKAGLTIGPPGDASLGTWGRHVNTGPTERLRPTVLTHADGDSVTLGCMSVPDPEAYGVNASKRSFSVGRTAISSDGFAPFEELLPMHAVGGDRVANSWLFVQQAENGVLAVVDGRIRQLDEPNPQRILVLGPSPGQQRDFGEPFGGEWMQTREGMPWFFGPTAWHAPTLRVAQLQADGWKERTLSLGGASFMQAFPAPHRAGGINALIGAWSSDPSGAGSAQLFALRGEGDLDDAGAGSGGVDGDCGGTDLSVCLGAWACDPADHGAFYCQAACAGKLSCQQQVVDGNCGIMDGFEIDTPRCCPNICSP